MDAKLGLVLYEEYDEDGSVVKWEQWEPLPYCAFCRDRGYRRNPALDSKKTSPYFIACKCKSKTEHEVFIDICRESILHKDSIRSRRERRSYKSEQ